MAWFRPHLVLVIAAMAPVVAWSQAAAGDPHLALRAKLGLPASSAVGEVRIFSEGYLSGGGASSLVARRERPGRWTVSRVYISGYGRTRSPIQSWRLRPAEVVELEALLDDPSAFKPSESTEPCLDPPSTELDVHWRGRVENVREVCDPPGVVERVQKILIGNRL